jgi:hypothetical protein
MDLEPATDAEDDPLQFEVGSIKGPEGSPHPVAEPLGSGLHSGR